MNEIPTLEYGPVSSATRVGDHDGQHLAILFMEDGQVRFSHVCTLARSGIVMRIAPLLQIGQGHTIVTRDPLTIVASILCGDCGIHGFVTDGHWVSV